MATAGGDCHWQGRQSGVNSCCTPITEDQHRVPHCNALFAAPPRAACHVPRAAAPTRPPTPPRWQRSATRWRRWRRRTRRCGWHVPRRTRGWAGSRPRPRSRHLHPSRRRRSGSGSSRQVRYGAARGPGSGYVLPMVQPRRRMSACGSLSACLALVPACRQRSSAILAPTINMYACPPLRSLCPRGASRPGA